MALISIIVPVYKVEKYLHRCVISLQKQTLRDIEIILVDDGSPDRCPVMCDQLALEDSRIKVVHKQNGGLSSARNAGIEIASGKYVGFVDSDDDVDLDMYQKMVAIAETNDVDFVMADYKRILDNGTNFLVSKNIRAGLYEKEDIVREIFPSLIMGENIDYGPILSVWHCIYRKDFLDKFDIRFSDDIKWSEDNLFSAFVGYFANRFYYMKKSVFYHYYQNTGSITTSYRPGAWDIYCRMNVNLRDFFNDRSDFDFSRQLQLHLLYYAFNTLGMECKHASGMVDAIKQTRKILNTPLLREAMNNFYIPNVNIKLRFLTFMVKWRLAFPVACIMRR